MSHEPFESLAGPYAIGALDGADLERFERHLAEGCEQCRAVVRETEEAMAAVAGAAPPMVPPPEVKVALLERAAAAAPAERPGGRRPRWLPWAVGTAAAVVAGAALTGGFVAGRYEAQLGQMARQALAQRQALQRQEAELRAEVDRYRHAVELLRDPATQVIVLRGLGPSPQASGRVVWNPAGGGHLFVSNLPPAPAGKRYELWTIAGAAPRPAGLFQVDQAGRASHRVPPLPEGPPVRVFAVTLEPAAGVDAPTGPMVLASK